MTQHSADAEAWAGQQVRRVIGLAAWTVAWVGSLALAAFGPGALWDDLPLLTLGAIVASVLVGIGMLFANKRHLQAMDEMQRAMQFQTMAWTLGAGLVGGVAWTLLARHELIGLEAEIGHLITFMAVVYLIGSIAGVLRYR